MGSKFLTLRQVAELVGLSQTTLRSLTNHPREYSGQVVHHHFERPSTPTDLGGEGSPPHPTESQSNLRLLKRVLVDLACNHTLSREVVSAVFQLVPGLREA